MRYTPFGTTGFNISKITLGTMTWGRQNTEAEGHAQMDYAVEQGINAFDTAELYAIPSTAEPSSLRWSRYPRMPLTLK